MDKNYLELVIEKEYVPAFKYIMNVVCSQTSCRIIFNTSNDDKKKYNIKLFSQDENKNSRFKAEIQEDKLRYFTCDVPKVDIMVSSDLLLERLRKIRANDAIIIYMKNTKDQLFIYNLDDNNNHY
ncbi:hypothetical protein [Saudi moumouvirus]|uniref:Proliferating cell nuclear antigen n=1 Tax=Moumouvirus sp. 'Monve' TaxID=1128131 RepID=H2EFM6_9VIRU|nr:hypothetical protein mv_R1089 [Moumouvirus Monve]AQN67907.1 hypothetical protein [Saudi moumouvirus]